MECYLVFHVSLLKQYIEPTATISPDPPSANEDVEGEVEPLAIIDRRVVHQGPLPLIQVLVQWSHRHPKNTSREYLPQLLNKFPRVAQLLTFLGDKEDLKGMGLSQALGHKCNKPVDA